MKIYIRHSSKLLFIILTLLFCSTAFSTAPISNNSLAPMLQTVLPSVVNVKAKIKITDFNTLRELQKQQEQNPNNNQPLPNTLTSVASGVIVDAVNGYILTNAHVVNDAESVTVTLSDGRHFDAKTIGIDKPSDVAVLQIKAKNLTAITLGNSSNVKVGDFVAAIGSPFGLNQSVTSGIVSAIGRTTLGIENFENFIQTDASINPGNSGGALINIQGQLIGLNTAILAPARGSIGIGFAIPVNMAKSVMDQLIKFGNVKRGLLGVGAQDLTPDLATAFDSKAKKGAAITLVLPSSPAQQAGIQVGDIITKINGTDIQSASDVVNTVGFLRVNTKINISLLRKNEAINLNLALTDQKTRDDILQKNDPFFNGVGMSNFAAITPIHGVVQGVLILSVQDDSAAARAKLNAGDVITSANQQPIHNIDELKTEAIKADKLLLLNVLRGGNALFLVINKES